MSASNHTVTLAFQSDLDRVAAEPAPRALRLVSHALAAFVMATIAVAAIARVDIDVTGHGRLESQNPLVLLQPLDRAIIRTLDVRPGDTVRKGQILATLDGTFARADLTDLVARLAHLTAESQRLRAEQAGEDPPLNDAVQAALSIQRLREYRARLDGFKQVIAQDEAEQATALHRIASLRHQVQVAREVLAMRAALMQGAVGSRLQYLDAVATLGQQTGELAAAQDRLAELSHASLSHQADRTSYIESWRRDIADAIARNRNELEDATAALAKAGRIQQLIDVTAPIDATVLDAAVRGPGSVLREAEPLFTLLPAQGGMQAIISVKSEDIGYVRTGDAVTLKIDAYNYARHGTLHGHVRAIAAASLDPIAPQSSDGTITHRVTVDLDPGTLTDLPPGTGPMPGMACAGDIRVGTRSVLEYFLTPITRGFASSLREP
jgi:HlyD family secretion protein